METYPTLCYKESWVSPNITLLPYWTLSQTPDLENFATVKAHTQNVKRIRF